MPNPDAEEHLSKAEQHLATIQVVYTTQSHSREMDELVNAVREIHAAVVALNED